MLDRCQCFADLRHAAGREQKWITAGEDDLPDLRVLRDIGERRALLGGGEGTFAVRPHHLAAEAKTAIDRADMQQLQQHAIGVAMHDAFDGRMGMVADRVGMLVWQRIEFAQIRQELPRDRVGGIIGSISAAISGVIATG